MSAIRGSKDRTPLLHDAGGSEVIENQVLGWRQQPFEAIYKPNDLPPEFFCSLGDSSEHGIQSRTIASAG
jgi:hypothetical protein